MTNNNTKEGKRYPYAEALKIAEAIVEELRPYCDRIEIGGSIRRKKADVGDIEIVAIAKPYQSGALEDGLAKVVNRWVKIKGDMVYNKTKYTQRLLPEGIKLDLFFATKENWGIILVIRTGSARYSHKILATGWVRQGFNSAGGFLYRNGQKYEVHEKENLFRLIGIPYIAPEFRDL